LKKKRDQIEHKKEKKDQIEQIGPKQKPK